MSLPSSQAQALRALPFFDELTDDDLVRVMRIGRRRSFGAGEIVVERDSDSGGLFVLLSGRVSVDAGGAIEELGPGGFFGEMALLGREERLKPARISSVSARWAGGEGPRASPPSIPLTRS